MPVDSGVLIPIVLFLTIGGVLVLRPVAKHLGAALEAYAKGGRPRVDSESDASRALLESIEIRLQRLEERQDFTDSLLQGDRAPLSGSLPQSRGPRAGGSLPPAQAPEGEATNEGDRPAG